MPMPFNVHIILGSNWLLVPWAQWVQFEQAESHVILIVQYVHVVDQYMHLVLGLYYVTIKIGWLKCMS